MKTQDIKVELVRHRGVIRTDVGTIEIDLPQQVILVNGVWAGYAPDAPGSHISIVLQRVTPEILEHIKSEVDRKRGAASPTIVQQSVLDEANVTVTTVDASPPAVPANVAEELV